MPVVNLPLLLSLVLVVAQSASTFEADPPIKCSDCAAWNAPREPFRVFGDTYFVGTVGLSAVLVTSDEGHILLDGGLSQSAPLIDASIRKLGFRTEDVKLIVNSHEHFDHAAGIAALQRASGASVAASAAAAPALQKGASLPHDPQAKALPFPPVKDVKIVADGEVLRVGPIELTAHFTPGHTPGAMTWSWTACEGTRCLNVVYADSLSAISDEGFRFTGDGTRPSIVETFRQSLAKVQGLPCDILLVPHPFSIGMDEKIARKEKEPNVNPFIDAAACRTYVAAQRKRLDARIATEKK